MLGLASTLAATTSDRRDDYKSLTGGNGNNYDPDTSTIAGGNFTVPDIPYSKGGNGIAFNTNYNTSSTFRGNYTMSFWYKSADGRDNNRASKYILGISEADPSVSNSDYFYFYITASGGFVVVGISNSDGHFAVSADQNLADGAIDWHHIALVVTKGSGASSTTTQVYVNGNASTMVNIQQFDESNHAAFNADGGLHVGGIQDNLLTDRVFVGGSILDYDFIDDFCLHSSALDADNITAMYNSGTPINLLANSGNYDTSGDVVLYYKFNGASDSGCLLDSHGTSNGTGGQFSTESAS